MKVSEITIRDVYEYLRLDDYEESTLFPILDTAKAFIQSYTGLDQAEIDNHEDFYIAVMVLCQDMYDNRSMYIDKNNLNKVVGTVLDMHCVNLL